MPVAGPYKMLSMVDGSLVPWFVLPFDKEGLCQAPQTAAKLRQELSSGQYTDLLLFSHGWNNDWAAATGLYERFIDGFQAMCRSHNLPFPAGFRPLLAGVFWPSAALMFPGEGAIQMAAGIPTDLDQRAAEEKRQLEDLASSLPLALTKRFYELAGADSLDEAGAKELAQLLAPQLGPPDGEVEVTAPEGSLLDVARELEQDPAQRGQGGFIGGNVGSPQAAGILSSFDPRMLLRLATVFQMKDRAGVVGAQGVHPLLADILRDTRVRVHLQGHSFGCKVMLSALTNGELTRRVRSALLLQPAVSHLCFASRIPDTDRAGGYRKALEGVEHPIYCTYSKQDFPLHDAFHLAVRRAADLGELKIAGDNPPNVYAGLGGYGPRGCEDQTSDLRIHGVLDAYTISPEEIRIVALDGVGVITGHGEITNDSVYWALYHLLVH